MHSILNDGRHAHSVSRLDGEVVAFVELETHWRDRVWVAFVGVTPELRDRGIGSNLVGWALAEQFEAGARSAMLMLSPANRTALRAYEKVGFRRARLIDVLEKTPLTSPFTDGEDPRSTTIACTGRTEPNRAKIDQG